MDSVDIRIMNQENKVCSPGLNKICIRNMGRNNNKLVINIFLISPNLFGTSKKSKIRIMNKLIMTFFVGNKLIKNNKNVITDALVSGWIVSRVLVIFIRLFFSAVDVDWSTRVFDQQAIRHAFYDQ